MMALENEQADFLHQLRRKEVQAIGAAISAGSWYDLERAYNALRDKMDAAGAWNTRALEAAQPQEAVAYLYASNEDRHVFLTRQTVAKDYYETPLYATPPIQAAEIGLLDGALERQCDNMAFVLNNVTLPGQWYGKFSRELAEDRALLAKAGKPGEER